MSRFRCWKQNANENRGIEIVARLRRRELDDSCGNDPQEDHSLRVETFTTLLRNEMKGCRWWMMVGNTLLLERDSNNVWTTRMELKFQWGHVVRLALCFTGLNN